MNPNIYITDYEDEVLKLTPVNHRTPIWTGFLDANVNSLQWIHDNFFDDYANGSVYPFWSSVTAYAQYDRVIDIDNAAYECQVAVTGGQEPYLNWQASLQPGFTGTGTWWQVNPDYRGVRPRVNYNGQKLVLMATLNQFFRTTFRQPPYGQLPDIYIVNNENYPNTILVVGYTENGSSSAVYNNGQAINFIEYNGSNYNYIDYAFTIYIPSALYFTISGGTGVEGVSIAHGNEGSGYGSTPTVQFTGDGTGAAGTAIMGTGPNSGKVISVTMTNNGSGYTTQPTVSFIGGSPSVTAMGYAIPENTAQGDNTIKNFANRYVIAGIFYNIKPY